MKDIVSPPFVSPDGTQYSWLDAYESTGTHVKTQHGSSKIVGRKHQELPTSFCCDVHQSAAVQYKERFNADMPQHSLMHMRDVEKLAAAAGLSSTSQATTADIMRS